MKKQKINHVQPKVYQLSLGKVIISLIMFILLWAIVTNAWNYTGLFFGAQKGSLVNTIYDFFSRFIWAIPAIVLLSYYSKCIPVTWKQLFTNMPHMKPLIITVAIIVLYNFGAMLFNHGGLWINPAFSFFKHFSTFIMVAFVEELVYRGWGLNALSMFLSEKKANIISTLFFVLLHLPAYFIKLYLTGTFPIATVVTQCVFVFILGLLFGYLYRRGKSLWSPMIVHFLADFLSIMLIG